MASFANARKRGLQLLVTVADGTGSGINLRPHAISARKDDHAGAADQF